MRVLWSLLAFLAGTLVLDAYTKWDERLDDYPEACYEWLQPGGGRHIYEWTMCPDRCNDQGTETGIKRNGIWEKTVGFPPPLSEEGDHCEADPSLYHKGVTDPKECRKRTLADARRYREKYKRRLDDCLAIKCEMPKQCRPYFKRELRD